MPSIIERDALVGNLLERLDQLEERVRILEATHPGLAGEAAGKLAYYREADGGQYAPEDVYPDGESDRGLFARMVNRAGISVYTDHFRSGAIPTGFSWIADGTFNGTPGGIDYSHRSSYLRVVADSTPHFLADAITTYSDRWFLARVSTGYATEIGLRLDDGSDDNYAEIILDPDNVGGYNVDFRYRAGGGAVTDTPGPYYPATELAVVALYWYSVTPAVWGYLYRENGDLASLNGFATGALAWTPARVGIKVQVNGGDPGIVDWFYSTFS